MVSASISRAFSRTAPARSIAASIASNTLADDEDFLLGDAEQVVVVGAAVNDRPGGVVEIGRLVDDDRRIARPGDDRPLADLQRRPGDGRAAGDADQLDAAVGEERVGRFQRRLGDHADQVVDAQVAVDRLVEPPHALGRDAACRWGAG